MATMEAQLGRFDRDRELNVLFEDENPKMKAADRERRRKTKWLSELITFIRMDFDGSTPKGCEWRVVRKKITKRFIQDLVNRCPIPCLVDYVYDNHGVAHWFDDLLMTAQPAPAQYVIAPQIIRTSIDILKDPTYQGQTSFVMKYVPKLAKDGVTPVTKETLKEYIFFAIAEEDPKSLAIEKSLGEIQKEINEITKVIKRIPKQEIRDHDNKLVPEEEADQEREIMYTMYGQAKYEIELRYKKREQDLKDHEAWRRSMGLELIPADEDLNTETFTWEIRLFGTADAKNMEDLLIAKDDWQGIKLACECEDPKLPPWAGRGAVPNGSKDFMPDYTELLVNISGVRVMRIQHGVGTQKALDSETATIKADRFGVYYGDWELGRKTGHGIEVNDSGIFSGRFIENRRDGYGQLDMANGTSVKATFKTVHDFPAPIITKGFDNPYLDGEPHEDKVEVMFADGAIYRGAMSNGVITGLGIYESAFGEQMAGGFVEGVLDCDVGKVTTHAGETLIGRWERGELSGKGAYEDDRGNRYKGYWKDGLKHGRGYEFTRKKGDYRGYFMTGLKHGKGELDFCKRKKVKEKAAADMTEDEKKSAIRKATRRTEYQADKASLTYQYRYQGFFFADFIANGGIAMDTLVQTPYCVARRDKTRTEKLMAYKNSLDVSAKRKTRANEKHSDLERYIRLEMMTKKDRIFRQQRHYLKKTMYFEDRYGLDPQIYEARKKVRENRMRKIDEQCLKSERAFIPRLQLKDACDMPAHHLERAFSHIEVHDIYDSNAKYDAGEVDTMLAKILVSDFEEAKERQNMMKYDRMWERAEAAYIQKKKTANAAKASQPRTGKQNT